MRRLMLLRHAKTEENAPDGSDINRRLDARGRIDAAAIGAWLARQAEQPARVLVSDAARARQTWQIAWESMEASANVRAPDVRHLPQLYGAGPAQLLQAVHTDGGDAVDVMIVAHNPGLHELALALSTQDNAGDSDARAALADNLPTSGLVTLEFTVGNWRQAAFGTGRLAGFVSPKTLKAVASST